MLPHFVLRTPYSIPSPSTRPPSPAPLALNLAAGLELIWLRQDRNEFGPAEGVLQGRAAQDRLAAQFPPGYTSPPPSWSDTLRARSGSSWSGFCASSRSRTWRLELDAMARGRVVHDVLALLHQRVNQRLGRPASPLELDAAEYDELLAVAIRQSLPPEPHNPLQAALREIDRRLVVDWLSRYREQCEKYDGQWKDFDRPMAPAIFEVSFGRSDASPPSTPTPLECRWKDQTVLISGRIDRIDVGAVAGQNVFNIVDYKSGGTIRLSEDAIRAGTTLQLPLYALAAMELLLAGREAVPWRAGYWYVRDRGFGPRQALSLSRLGDNGRSNLTTGGESAKSSSKPSPGS